MVWNLHELRSSAALPSLPFHLSLAQCQEKSGRKETEEQSEQSRVLVKELSWFSCCSIAKSCPTLCNLMDCSLPGFPSPHHLPEFAQVHVHWISDVIQPSCPLSPTSPSAFNPSQLQGLLQWVSCLYQVAKLLELQLQHQSFQRLFGVDFL